MTSRLNIRPTSEGVSLAVRAQPGARKSRVVGVHDGALKVAVTAPPSDGRANDALAAFLAESIGLKPYEVRLTQGRADRRKHFEFVGLTPEALREALRPLLPNIDQTDS